MKYSNRKSTIFLIVLSVASLLIAIIGATFAYFTASVSGNTSATPTVITTANNLGITYEDGALVVNGSATTSYAIEGLRNYHFSEDGEAGVESLRANVVRVYSLDDNTIGVENAPNGSKISLVNINGFVVFSSKAAPSGVATVSLPKEKGLLLKEE